MWKNNTIVFFKNIIILPILGGLMYSCSSSSKISDSDNKQLDDLVSGERFEIISDRAFPLATTSLNNVLNSGLLPPGNSAGQISLIGNPNHFKVMGDSVAIYLPYYGERQMGGGYNNNGPGIEFKGIPKRMKITKDEQKQRYTIQVEVKDESENITFNIMLFPNFTSMINVNSSQRFSIRYSGSVKAISEGE